MIPTLSQLLNGIFAVTTPVFLLIGIIIGQLNKVWVAIIAIVLVLLIFGILAIPQIPQYCVPLVNWCI